MRMRCHTSITTLDINKRMVLKKLTNFNIGKSAGPDNIHPHMQKECAVNLIVPLTELYKRSINKMHVAVGWMNANTSAISKKGNNTIVSNYLQSVRINHKRPPYIMPTR